jgi:hypothetical protein
MNAVDFAPVIPALRVGIEDEVVGSRSRAGVPGGRSKLVLMAFVPNALIAVVVLEMVTIKERVRSVQRISRGAPS